MTTLVRPFVLPFLIAALGGCAPSPGPSPMPRGGSSETLLLTVQNDNYWDATIHANWGGVRDRVGFVVGKTTETFAFEWRREDVRFDVAFIGDGGWQSEMMVVFPGDHLELRILPGPTGRMAPGLR